MPTRQPVSIKSQPWFDDHIFGGRVILAAVETMVLLASTAKSTHPDIDVRVMENGRFAKFLEIPPQTSSIPALVEWEEKEEGHLQTKLLSQVQLKSMRRIKEHGEITFSSSPIVEPPAVAITPSPPAGKTKEITAEQIYNSIIPFGPGYQTLQDKLYLWGEGAFGRLKAPRYPFIDPVQNLIGSPFPLDGAMHAACILGREYVNFTPFPVGFDKRIVFEPSQPGANYTTKIIPVSKSKNELVFDVAIFSLKAELIEAVSGLCMRDVTGAARGR